MCIHSPFLHPKPSTDTKNRKSVCVCVFVHAFFVHACTFFKVLCLFVCVHAWMGRWIDTNRSWTVQSLFRSREKYLSTANQEQTLREHLVATLLDDVHRLYQSLTTMCLKESCRLDAVGMALTLQPLQNGSKHLEI